MSDELTRFEQSASIEKISAALAAAQGEIEGAKKDAENPAFKRGNQMSKYATLSAVWDACRAALSKHGIAVHQGLSRHGNDLLVRTMVMHAGEWIASTLALPVEKATAQGYGSGYTYGRRYGLAAAVGVAPDDDDDGNAASGKAAPSPKAEPPNIAALREKVEAKTKPSALTPWDRIQISGKEYGATEEVLMALTKQVTGKKSTAQLTDEDVLKVGKALQEKASP